MSNQQLIKTRLNAVDFSRTLKNIFGGNTTINKFITFVHIKKIIKPAKVNNDLWENPSCKKDTMNPLKFYNFILASI